MSQRVYYEVDGHVRGPISFTQLQLMAVSGMLLPHHRIRREDTDQWFAAQSVRGLFSETNPPPPVGGVAPENPNPAPMEENGHGGFTVEPAEPTEFNTAFDFFSDPEPSAQPQKPPVSGRDLNEPVDLPEADALPDNPPAAPQNKPSAAKSAESQSEAKKLTKNEPSGAVAPAPAATEVTGRAVELLPDNAFRLMDGKTSFRLNRAWLLATSKFSDGTTRTTYMRLQQIDAASIDQCANQTRGKSEPLSLLSFIAGAARVGLVFQGSEKPYRAFLEKALLLCGPIGPPPKPAGKT